MSQDPSKRHLDKLREQLNKNNPNQRPGGPRKPGKGGFNFYWIYGAIFALLIFGSLFSEIGGVTKNVGYAEFEEALHKGDIEKIEIVNEKQIYIYIDQEALQNEDVYEDLRKNNLGGDNVNQPHYHFEMPADHFRDELAAYYESHPEAEKIRPVYITKKSLFDGIFSWLPFLLIIVFWIFIMRRMSGGGAGGAGGSQIFNIGKSRAKVIDKDTEVKTTFKEVAGMEGAKDEVKEVVDFLKNPGKYSELGGRIPKGVMLSGPPGTGKTLLAKAVAGEAQVPFFSLSGSDFVEMFVGVGASRVRDLFKKAKEKSPSIIFIDEIDAIGRARGGKGNFTGGNDERENTLNQLLTEMDGFGTNDNVIVMAATNRADVLDRALMRAGRFDRIVYVDLPELNEREDIFKVHLRKIKTDDTVDVEFLSKQTPGFSGADIANVCNEAALIAARKGKGNVGKQDFLDAVDRIVGGLEKKTKIITGSEKKVIAYHEAGHAAVSWLLEHASPLVKVTIVPRGKSLGAAWYLPEERSITTPNQLKDEMCATMGGRAAEAVIFEEISTGALSDLEKVTRQARAMVTVYGLNDKIGNITYYDSSGQNDQFNKPYSEQTAEIIDKEISGLVEAQYARAVELLKANKDKLVQLAEILLEKEVIFRETMIEVFGERPWDEAKQKERALAEEASKERRAKEREELEAVRAANMAKQNEDTAKAPAATDEAPAAEPAAEEPAPEQPSSPEEPAAESAPDAEEKE